LYGGVNGLAFRDSLHGLVWGFLNSTTQTITVMNTTNGGHTWATIPANLYIGRNSFCAIPGTYGFMSVGLNQAASAYATSVTYNDGADWTIIESNTSNTEKIAVVQMTDTLHGWAGTHTTGTTNGMNKYMGSNLAGIQQVKNNNNQLVVYPNPAQDILNIEYLLVNENASLQIIDMLGNVVKQVPFNTKHVTINIADMQKGVYLLRMQNGVANSVQKLIIQ
jgi:hypothetical protein